MAQPLEDLARKFKYKVAAFDNNPNSKYFLESDPSPNSIEDFRSGLADGTVSVLRYSWSELVPDNSHKNVLLEARSKQVLKLAKHKHFKGFENLAFARIDASVNEHTKLQVDDFPTILLYKFGDKDTAIN
ncbi:unnamed protein product [Eruca vesicaria subsp. sativa]|uniref:Thioredoxin domain-containing protein n=1 Tax=Eruca vesicaria subsp. sativa TaxID=29727 RepID=A0ABC8J1B6_ERUVS|nr:unnamed protein product [Eruca vesicaria subsp. sativa]